MKSGNVLFIDQTEGMAKKLSLLLALLLISVGAIAGPRYESFISDGHQVLFFYPKVLSAAGSKDKFEYDFTHQEGTDSVTFNFSVISKAKPAVSQITLTDGNGQTLRPKYFKLLFCEYAKGIYTSRVQTSFAYDDFKRLFLTAGKVVFRVEVNGKEVDFEYKAKQWLKEQEMMNIILNLFD